MFSIQRFEFDRSYSDLKSGYSTILKKSACTKFQMDISKTERLVRVYTGRRTKLYQKLYMYIFIGSSMFPSGFWQTLEALLRG